MLIGLQETVEQNKSRLFVVEALKGLPVSLFKFAVGVLFNHKLIRMKRDHPTMERRHRQCELSRQVAIKQYAKSDAPIDITGRRRR